MNLPNSPTPGAQKAPLALIVLCTAMAAGMGWGIRGQYGHETGAMIAGALTSLVLVLFFIPQASSLLAARAAAMMTVAIGIGGTMTYGQTIGLTQDQTLIGNWEALRWGLLGLFIKGGLWIGFAGAFLGMGLSGKIYRPREILILMLGLTLSVFVGVWLLNSPFEPANRVLPKIYFSGSWYWQPDKVDLKPRPEVWGGLLVAFVSLLGYTRLIRGDRLVTRLGWIGFIAGGLGFAGGQCIQAFQAWNRDLFESGWLSSYPVFRYVNWWNMMEISFGLVFGAGLAIGLWWSKSLIKIEEQDETVTLSPTEEIFLVLLHSSLLIIAEFLDLPGIGRIFSQYVNYGLIMCVIPMVGIIGGRLWPYMLLLPIVAAPICGKQMRALCFNSEPNFGSEIGWVLFVMVPLGITITLATWLISQSTRSMRAQTVAAIALWVNTILYFGLNTLFFQFAWPWNEWTGRTPSQIIFIFFGLSLLALALFTLIRATSYAKTK
jgi:hypothetical protein